MLQRLCSWPVRSLETKQNKKGKKEKEKKENRKKRKKRGTLELVFLLAGIRFPWLYPHECSPFGNPVIYPLLGHICLEHQHAVFTTQCSEIIFITPRKYNHRWEAKFPFQSNDRETTQSVIWLCTFPKLFFPPISPSLFLQLSRH